MWLGCSVVNCYHRWDRTNALYALRAYAIKNRGIQRDRHTFRCGPCVQGSSDNDGSINARLTYVVLAGSWPIFAKGFLATVYAAVCRASPQMCSLAPYGPSLLLAPPRDRGKPLPGTYWHIGKVTQGALGLAEPHCLARARSYDALALIRSASVVGPSLYSLSLMVAVHIQLGVVAFRIVPSSPTLGAPCQT